MHRVDDHSDYFCIFYRLMYFFDVTLNGLDILKEDLE